MINNSSVDACVGSTLSADTCINSILMLSVVGFFIIFTIITVLPTLIEQRLKSKVGEKKDVLILLMDPDFKDYFSVRFTTKMTEESTLKWFLLFSLIFLLSGIICLFNITFETEHFDLILQCNLILIFSVMLSTFSYIIILIVSSWVMTPKDFDNLMKEVKWLVSETESNGKASIQETQKQTEEKKLSKEETKKLSEESKQEGETDLDIDVEVSDLHKHGENYELNLVYYVLNKVEKGTTIRDVKYYFSDPINKEMPELIEDSTQRKQVATLYNKGPLHLLPNESKRIDDFIPSYPLSENLKIEFTLIHTHGETKVIRDLKIRFK